jgi:hypothetical protein
MDEPVHDWASHAADAMRVMAEAVMHGMVEGGSREAVEGRRMSRGAPQVVMGFRGEEQPGRQHVVINA